MIHSYSCHQRTLVSEPWLVISITQNLPEISSHWRVATDDDCSYLALNCFELNHMCQVEHNVADTLVDSESLIEAAASFSAVVIAKAAAFDAIQMILVVALFGVVERLSDACTLPPCGTNSFVVGRMIPGYGEFTNGVE